MPPGGHLSPEQISVIKSWVSQGAKAETAIDFFEDGCRSRIRQTISGQAFVGEQEQLGYVVRSADLTGVGDHLINFESDAQAEYLFTIEVVPDRLQAQ